MLLTSETDVDSGAGTPRDATARRGGGSGVRCRPLVVCGASLAAAIAVVYCASPSLLRAAGFGKELAAARVPTTEGLAVIEKDKVAKKETRRVPPGLKCEIPEDFCQTDPDRKDWLSYLDCDGDGHLDPYCEGGELLRFGYISSANGCENNWPNGLCKATKARSGEWVSTPERAAGHELTIVHFNDVYEIAGVLDDGVRKGGMSRAAHVIDKERKRNPERTFVVFAGDLLSPSSLSQLFQGQQMIDILNHLQLDAASLGNHEFDFGLETMLERIKESNFPWLNVNLLDQHGELLEGTQKSLVREVSFTPKWGREEVKTKVCIFGAVYDVRESISKDKDRVCHVDTISSSKAEAKRLREEGCQVVIALTHQLAAYDCELSRELGEDVDLILGGHDHHTEMTTLCGHAPVVKADSDLKTQWIMTLWLDDEGRPMSTDGRLITLTNDDAFDVDLHEKVVEWEEKAEKQLNVPIGCLAVNLYTDKDKLRRQEMPLGNFVTDAIRSQAGTDVAIFNGGALRGDKVYHPGKLSIRTMTELNPFGNTIVKIYMTGAEFRDYLAEQLECVDDGCGNFVHISGLKYAFNPKAPKGRRLTSLSHLDGRPLLDKETLTVAMCDYQLATSKYKHNKFYNMVTLNDGVHLLSALVDAAKAAGETCISPKVDGRISIESS